MSPSSWAFAASFPYLAVFVVVVMVLLIGAALHSVITNRYHLTLSHGDSKLEMKPPAPKKVQLPTRKKGARVPRLVFAPEVGRPVLPADAAGASLPEVEPAVESIVSPPK